MVKDVRITFQEIYSLADRISLKVPDIDTFIDNLNSVGYLLKKGPKTYQVIPFSLYSLLRFVWLQSQISLTSTVNGAIYVYPSYQ